MLLLSAVSHFNSPDETKTASIIVEESVYPQYMGIAPGPEYKSLPIMSTIDPPLASTNLGKTMLACTGSRISIWCAKLGPTEATPRVMATKPGESDLGTVHTLDAYATGSIETPK